MIEEQQRTFRTANSLRSDWVQINIHDLLDVVKDDQLAGIDEWTLTPWQRQYGSREIMRSFLLHSQGGSVYAIYLRRIRKGCT